MANLIPATLTFEALSVEVAALLANPLLVSLMLATLAFAFAPKLWSLIKRMAAARR